MTSTEPPSAYHPVSKLFHWLIVVMLAIEFIVGLLLHDMRRSITPATLMSFHMSFGMLILAVMALRLLWRFVYPAPSHEPGMTRWQELASSWTHYLLYLSVILLPLTGWLLASAFGWSVTIFSLFTLPSIIAPHIVTQRLALYAHVLTAAGVLALIGLHMLAVLYHHFIRKDKVLHRMLP